jgi:hypothetical protein
MYAGLRSTCWLSGAEYGADADFQHLHSLHHCVVHCTQTQPACTGSRCADPLLLLLLLLLLLHTALQLLLLPLL